MAVEWKQFGTGAEIPGDVQPQNRWWAERGHIEMAQAITATINTLSQIDAARQTQFQISGRLYGNANMIGLNGLSFAKVQATSPLKDRITYNVVASGIDTITAKTVKNKPKPLFLTSGGDWKMQRRAEKLSKFVDGIFYENDAYDQGHIAFRDSAVLGDGFTHVFEHYGRVKFERVIASELLVDPMESLYGQPRQMHRTKNVDRAVLLDSYPGKRSAILSANTVRMESGAYQTVSDQVTVAESWRLPSGPEATDGLHVICMENDVLFKEPWKKDHFPFARLPWSTRLYGYWAQGGAEQIQNIQLEINKLLWVIQRSMHMAGTQKILCERGAKIVKGHLTNDYGLILEYTGTQPSYIAPPIVPPEIYSHLQTLKSAAFEQLGVSQMSASGLKPAGLDSGRALREHQDIESERFTVIAQQYDRYYLDLARLAIETTQEIFEDAGTYKVTMPGKKFLETIDWADIDLDDEEYVMQSFPISSLPSDPAGRLQTIQEYIQAGMISPRSGRRYLSFPDLEASDRLANAKEDWLHEVLEKMMDDGIWYEPEPTDDLALAKELVLDYIAYAKKIDCEEAHIQMLRDFNDELQAMAVASQPPAGGMGTPQAVPMAPPQSNMVPNVPGMAAAAA